jgi:exosome complex RNA-binding protein Rrp4
VTLYQKKKKEEEVQTKRKTFKAQSIFVTEVQNIQPLKEILVTVTGDDFELRVLNGNQVKIQPKSTEKYTTIIKALAEKHTEFQI